MAGDLQNDEEGTPISNINVTPFVDVVLVAVFDSIGVVHTLEGLLGDFLRRRGEK